MKCLGFPLFGLFVVCACSSGSGSSGGSAPSGNPTPGGSTTASFCDAVCSKYSQCDSTFDTQTCSADCANELAVSGPRLRTDYISRVQSCFTAKDCATVLSDTADSVCSDEALAVLAPTQVGIAFCDGLAGTYNKCGSSLDKADCLEAAKTFNDATLSNAQTCFSKACADVSACVSASLGIQSSSDY